MKLIRLAASLALMFLALLPEASAQMMSGQITGRLADPAGAVIVGAKVQLTNDLTKQVREFNTDSNGNFTFANVTPGNYTLKVAQTGFKAYEQKGINVGAVERVSLPEIMLQVGDVSTSVEVMASAVRVNTDSSDRGTAITTTQIEDTVTKGRNFMMLMATLPGVQDTNQNNSRGWGTGSPTIMGGQSGQKMLVLDGAASQDSGNRDFGYIAPSIDAISEVKVLVANFNAEYGARSGGQMNIMIKGGTNEWHGSAFYFLRNEALNANEFFNNKTNVRRAAYKFHNLGATLGGPFIIPGTSFNKDHNKLFWFFSYDYLKNKGVNAPQRFTMPTALERQGNYSQTVTTAGALVPIKDPTTGAQFPGNIIPTARIDRTGLAMMNVFPLPNATDPTGQRQYNSEFINNFEQPRHDRILRVDYPISSKDNFYVRLLQDYFYNGGYGQILGALGNGWRQFPHAYSIPSAGVASSWIHTFSPNVILETMYGITRGHQMNNPIDEEMYNNSLLPLKDAQGTIPLPRLFPTANHLNLKPQINFGLPSGFSAQSSGQGVTNAPAFGFDSRWPFDGTDQVQTISSNLTWIKGSHTMKFGGYFERMARNVSVYSTYNIAGSYYFGSDTSSAVDTGYPFSNLLTGGFFAYGEDNIKQVNHARYNQFDWYAQDTWKVMPRLTFDIGMRFQHMGPLHTTDQRLGLFSASAYDRNKAGQPLYPILENGVKRSQNPVTGAVYPYVRQGTFDPASYTGMPFSGIKDYIGNFWKAPPITLGPRVGFAYDLTGNGKTAIRGGFGIFYDRAATVDYIGALGVGRGPLAAAPNFLAPIVLNNSFTGLAGAQALLAPQDVQGGSEEHRAPTTYNYSFGIQRDIGWNMIADVAFVGNQFKHGYEGALGTVLDANAVAPFTTWTPAGGTNPVYRDPTSSGLYSTNLIRSMVGYKGVGAVPIFSNQTTSNYNSLQVQLNRRAGKNLTWSANYTWSKTLRYERQQWTDDALTRYETANRPHAFNANFGYEFPSYTNGNNFMKQLTSGWRFMGTAQIFSGSATGPTCGFQSNPVGYPNGTPTGSVLFRCQMTNTEAGGFWLPDGAKPSDVGSTQDPNLWYPVNPNNFQLPKNYSTFSRGMIGNAPRNLFHGPGMQLFNLSLMKVIRFHESHRVEIKAEANNALNHFNPANPNMTITRNYNTGVNTNAAFGSITGTQYEARRIILSLRYAF